MSEKTNYKKRKSVRVIRKYNTAKLIKMAVIVLIVCVFAVAIKNIFVLQAEQRKLQEEKKNLMAEKEVLRNELKNVNDRDYIEEQARIQLRMIKPGEIIYILQEEQKNGDESKKDD